MTTSLDTVVIGGGAMGSAAAWALASRGRALVGAGRSIFWLIVGTATGLVSVMLVFPPLSDIMRFAVPGVSQLLGGIAVGMVAGGWYAGRPWFGPTRPPGVSAGHVTPGFAMTTRRVSE